MSIVPSKRKIYVWLSAMLLLVGICSWIPYLVYQIEKPYGMLTFVLNPIGLVLGLLSKNKWLTLSNLFMVCSFIPVMAFVYLTRGYIPM